MGSFEHCTLRLAFADVAKCQLLASQHQICLQAAAPPVLLLLLLLLPGIIPSATHLMQRRMLVGVSLCGLRCGQLQQDSHKQDVSMTGVSQVVANIHGNP